MAFSFKAVAQNSPEQISLEASTQLEEIQNAITVSEERRAQLRAEMEELEGDRNRQSAALIAAAQRVKLTEIEVDDIEKRLGILLESESRIVTRLENSDNEISSLLAALQRISKNPPPALIIDPSDALNSARSASLLTSILPELRQRAEIIVSDLNQLDATKNRVLEEKQQLSARYSSLLEEQLRIATLIEARKLGVVRVGADLATEEALAEQLASEATSLGELVDTLKQRIASISEAADAAQEAENLQGNQNIPALDADVVVAALANTDRVSPAFPFASAKGYLSAPAAGVVVMEFGANDGFGGVAQGTSILTRADARVVSPADGWVMYKGPYLNYGQIIIINPGNEHTILLAGLDKIDVDLGQFILLGEPVGTMGSRTIGQTITTSAGVSRPTLYIEFRKQDQALDPAPWWDRQSVQNPAQAQAQPQSE
ncbi:MAG: peptidoglycan DD-metalloendopeptidase family protein [Devosiaceae bacterium]|nr:peptidoglycan DD-metalloendopeptidase family protein [Devosiaceae bacterium]